MKKFTTAKFDGINYPVFVKQNKPYSLKYTDTCIYAKITSTSEYKLVDDKTLPGDYFARLFQLEDRITFDYTCRNLQDLIFCKGKWGVDCKAIPHDFSNTVTAPVEFRRVVRIKNNVIWVRGISYPFKIQTKEKICVDDNLYAKIVFVNGEWFLREFSLFPELKRKFEYI